MSLAIVTDSTACLPPYQVAQTGVTVAPVQVTIGEDTFDEGVNIASLQVVSALTQGKEVTTNKPAPETFSQIYRH